MSRRFDTNDPADRARGLDLALGAVQRGSLVVLPTDTVYGVGVDAFNGFAVTALLAAKGRGRDMPVPVLIGSPRTLSGIASMVNTNARALVEAFWPGGLTVILRAQPTLQWDLGDSDGTVAVRMPLHPVAIELLQNTGPMAVSSANISGMPAPATYQEAFEQLGDAVEIYLDGGPTGAPVASTIVDVTSDVPRVLRAGAVSADELREVVPETEG